MDAPNVVAGDALKPPAPAPKVDDGVGGAPKAVDVGAEAPKPEEVEPALPKPEEAGVGAPKPEEAGVDIPKPDDTGAEEGPKLVDAGAAAEVPPKPKALCPGAALWLEPPNVKAGPALGVAG